MVSRRVLTLCIPSSFVIVIVVMVAVVGSWSGPLVRRLKSRYIPTGTTLANRWAKRSMKPTIKVSTEDLGHDAS
ncbi:hypothetical protein Tco_0630773 [Tanacetum coccineum]